MYRIYMERFEGPDFVYKRETYQEARCLANSQQKDYTEAVEISDMTTGEILYAKRVNANRDGWIIEVSDKK